MEANGGVNYLLRALDQRTKALTTKPPGLELGVIMDDWSLKLDRFPHPIPKNVYLVCRTLTLPGDQMTATPNGGDWQGSPSVKAADGNTYPIQGHHGHGPDGGHPQYSGDGVHVHPPNDGKDDHFHTVLTPQQLRPLYKGDRVLVAWVNDYNDPVIIDIVVPGANIEKEPKWKGPLPA